MWTYFAIFLSIAALLIVFGRRVFLYYVKPAKTEKKEKETVEEKGDTLIPDTGKISKEDALKVLDFSEKGEMMIKGGRDEEAIKLFVQALSIDNKHVDTMNKLAMLYLQKQMYAAASALFKELAVLTNDAVHFSHLGFALYQQNAYEEARDAYAEAIKIDPSRPQRFVSMAQVYRSMSLLQNAIIALNKALELEKENAEILFLLAEIYAENGQFEGARMALNKILEIDPENEDAKRFLKSVIGMEKARLE